MQISSEEQQLMLQLVVMENRSLAFEIFEMIFRNSTLQQDVLNRFLEIHKMSGNNEHFIDNCIKAVPCLTTFVKKQEFYYEKDH